MMVYLIIMSLVIIAAILGFEINGTLKENGIKVIYFDSGLSNIINFYKLIKREKNKKIKRKYVSLLVSFVIATVLFILVAIIACIRNYP